METLNSKLLTLNVFALTNEEMINIRGGEGDVVIKPITPPVVI